MKRLAILICGVFIIGFASACQPASSSISPVTAIPNAQNTSTVPAAPVMPTVTISTTAEVRAATPTPRSENLPLGSAMQIAAATDAALQVTPRVPMTFEAFPVRMTFDEFYDGYNMRTGLILSDKLLALDGREVLMEGYMAPPLKPELDFFVLTRVRLAFCPFCSTAGDWPDDIALVYLGADTTTATTVPVRVVGRLEVGASVDPETGMVSLVRIYASQFEVLA
jgi:hypothetical protein